MKKSEKRDRRKTIRSSGVFPYKLREAQRLQVIRQFRANGKSVHGPQTFTLGIILEHCIKEEIPFTLKGQAGKGFVVIKGIQPELPTIFSGAAGKVIHEKLSTLPVSHKG